MDKNYFLMLLKNATKYSRAIVISDIFFLNTG